MFKLFVEVTLRYVPPMSEHGQGISLVREFELPFPPFTSLALTGNSLNDQPNPNGLQLRDVTWDVDRHVFLGWTSVTSVDYPLGYVPDDIRSWQERGWRLGRLEEAYASDELEEESATTTETTPIETGGEVDDDDPENWQSLPVRRRPQRFNQFLRALVRVMAATYDNCETAFAMDKTKMVFSEQELKVDRDSPSKRAFLEAEHEFRRMTQDAQFKWRERVMSKYPGLDKVVAEW